METVSFISTESGVDLILSFAVARTGHPNEIESLILMRTPKYEMLLDESERGVRVSFERNQVDEDDFLKAIDYSSADSIVRIKTNSSHYELDVRRVDLAQIAKMCDLLKSMNYDERFHAHGI